LFRFTQIRFARKLLKLGYVSGMFLVEALIFGVVGHQLLPDGLGKRAHERFTSPAEIPTLEG
jgi:hypothetical protein